MEEIIKYVSTQGLAVVLVSLMIYFGIQFFNILLEKYKRKNEVKHHDELSVLRRQIGKEVEAVLQTMVIKTHGARAYVFEFHNGTVSMGGLPFCKMSCTYEVLNENTNSIIDSRQDVSTFLYSKFIKAIYENKSVIADTLNRTDVESTLGYETLVKCGVVITIRAKACYKNNKVLGYIGVDYTSPQSDETINEATRIIEDTSIKIGALLSINE